MAEQQSRVAQLKALDRLYDEFERLWTDGQRPAVADFLARVPLVIHGHALPELLAIEVDGRRELGEHPIAADYLSAFSKHQHIVLRLFDRDQAIQDTTQPSATFNSETLTDAQAAPTLDDYEILEELGRGGMGIVYKARQKSLDRIVAVKVIRAGEFAVREQIDRFLSEAKATARLQHPGIVNIFEVGQSVDQYYISMEYIQGHTLDHVLKSSGAPEIKVLGYVGEVADAIQFAHENGIIHRDIKPANILIDQFGRARVMDFGLARMERSDGDLTGTGQILGTPSYMSPEQARGDRSATDHRTDVYALGALLYRVLSGRPVFSSDSAADTIAMIVRDAPVPLREQRSNVSEALESLCLRCLSKRPVDRPDSAAEFLAELESATAKAQPMLEGKDRLPRHWLTGVGAIGGLGLLLAAVIITIKTGDRDTTVDVKGEADIQARDGAVPVSSDGQTITVHNDAAAQNSLDTVPITDMSPEQTSDAAAQAGVVGISALDQLRREDIDPYELQFAGHGDPDNAPDGLVAVLGDSLGRHPTVVEDVAFSPDGQKIASIDRGSNVMIWDAGTLKRKSSFFSEADCQLSYSVDDNTLATWGRSDRIRIWNASTGRIIATVPARFSGFSPGDCRALGFARKGATLAVLGEDGSQDRHIRFWRCDDQGIPTDDGVTISVDNKSCSLAISPDGQRIATGTIDGRLTLWSAAGTPERVADWQVEGVTPAQLAEWDVKRLKIHQVDFSSDGKLLAAACDKNGCLAWDVTRKTPELIHSLARHHGWPYETVAFTPDDSRIVGGAIVEELHVWPDPAGDPESADVIETTIYGGANECMAISPDGTIIVAGQHDGFLRSRDLATGEERTTRRGHWSRHAIVEHIAPDGSELFTRATDSRLIHWTVDGGQIQESRVSRLHHIGDRTLAMDASGQWLTETASNVGPAPIKIRKLINGRAVQIRQFTNETVTRHLAMSSDGKRFASFQDNAEILLWDTESGDHIVVDRFAKHTYMRHGLAFSPDGKRLAVTGDPSPGEAAIRIHDISVSPPEHLENLDIFPVGLPSSLEFSSDGNLLLYCGPDGLGVVDVSGERTEHVYESDTRFIDGQFGTFSPDGSMVALSLDVDRLEIRDTRDFRLLRNWGGLRRSLHAKFAPDNRHLFRGNTDGTVYVLRLADFPSPPPVVGNETARMKPRQ